MIQATYIDHMGNDLSVVNAARVSFGKKSTHVYTDESNSPNVLYVRDVNLIKYLIPVDGKGTRTSIYDFLFARWFLEVT